MPNEWVVGHFQANLGPVRFEWPAGNSRPLWISGYNRHVAKSRTRVAIERSKDANSLISIGERSWKVFKILSPVAAASVLAWLTHLFRAAPYWASWLAGIGGATIVLLVFCMLKILEVRKMLADSTASKVVTEKDYKRELIKEWRQMLLEVATIAQVYTTFGANLRIRPEFMKLEAYLSEQVIQELDNLEVVGFKPGQVLRTKALEDLKTEISRIEREWDL